MAGWQDYGFYPGGICTMAQQWVAVEGLAAAFNERVALFEDTGSLKPFVKFNIANYKTPSLALLGLARLFFSEVFCTGYFRERMFRDGYAWCVDDPLSGDFISKTLVEQRDLALAWLGNFFGFDAINVPENIAMNLFKFRPWGEACRNLYLLINNWRYHYELADYIVFERENVGDYLDSEEETIRRLFEAGEASGWPEQSGRRHSFDRISNSNYGIICFINSGYGGAWYDYAYFCRVIWMPRGAGFCARADLPDLANCAAGYIAMIGECDNWLSLSAVYPPGTIFTARAQPGVECYSPFANWSFVPEPDNFTTHFTTARFERALVCYDLAPKLSFYRAEDRIVKN